MKHAFAALAAASMALASSMTHAAVIRDHGYMDVRLTDIAVTTFDVDPGDQWQPSFEWAFKNQETSIVIDECPESVSDCKTTAATDGFLGSVRLRREPAPAADYFGRATSTYLLAQVGNESEQDFNIRVTTSTQAPRPDPLWDGRTLRLAPHTGLIFSGNYSIEGNVYTGQPYNGPTAAAADIQLQILSPGFLPAPTFSRHVELTTYVNGGSFISGLAATSYVNQTDEYQDITLVGSVSAQVRSLSSTVPAVPEPASTALLAAGLLAVLVGRLRRPACGKAAGVGNTGPSHLVQSSIAGVFIATLGAAAHANTSSSQLRLENLKFSAFDLRADDDATPSFELLAGGTTTISYGERQAWHTAQVIQTDTRAGLLPPTNVAWDTGRTALQVALTANGFQLSSSSSLAPYGSDVQLYSGSASSSSPLIRLAPRSGLIVSGTFELTGAQQCSGKAWEVVQCDPVGSIQMSLAPAGASFNSAGGVGDVLYRDHHRANLAVYYTNASDQAVDLSFILRARLENHNYIEPVPEPEAIALLVSGLLVGGLVRRSRGGRSATEACPSLLSLKGIQ